MKAEKIIDVATRILDMIDTEGEPEDIRSGIQAAKLVLAEYDEAQEHPKADRTRAIFTRVYVSPEEVREGETFFEPAADTVCRQLMDQARKQDCIYLYTIPMESGGYYLGGKLLAIDPRQ